MDEEEKEGGGSGSGFIRLWTMGVLVLILACQFVRWLWSHFRFGSRVKPGASYTNGAVASSSSDLLQPRISSLISDLDLQHLLDDLKEKLHEDDEKWENVIDRRNNLFSYTAKCCKAKDAPLKYLSVTVFENCSYELLREFYMDNCYRKVWDKTLMEHELLQVEESNGTETGRMVKKFPFLTPREYVLAWRVWEDKEGSFYCLSKGCEHPVAPRQKKYVRVMFFWSGWRIRKVAGRNACEIKMVHQEDAGLNVDLAKLAFKKGIWSYICAMDNAYRKYSPKPTSVFSAAIQKVPPELDDIEDVAHTSHPETSTASNISSPEASDCSTSKISKNSSKKLIENGLILLGGAICLSRGHLNLGAKVAIAYILTKLTKNGTLSRQSRQSG